MQALLKRPSAVMVAAVAFGITVAVLKGEDAGIRNSIGNISAPWLLLPYFAGTLGGKAIRGSLIGLATCLAALAGFYVAEAFVLDLGGHPLLTNLTLTLRAGWIYFVAGLVCGPLFGALGGIRTRYRRAMTAGVVGLLLMGEPLAVFVWLSRQGLSPADTSLVVNYPALWIGEVVLGFLLSAGVLWLGRVRSTSGTRPAGMG
jgi:hypothetical protein